MEKPKAVTGNGRGKGMGFRRGIALGTVILLLAGAVFEWFQPEVKRNPPMAPLVEPGHGVSLPAFKFTLVNRQRGIDFVSENGAYGEKLLPETMGQGVAVVDIDGDGDDDLVFANSKPWPWHDYLRANNTAAMRVLAAGSGEVKPAGSGKASTRTRFPALVIYTNDGSGHFTRSHQRELAHLSAYGQGIYASDLNGDGYADLLLTALGKNHLLMSHGGHYVDTPTVLAGNATDWHTAAAWLDFDRDGDLDVVIGSYVRWTAQIDRSVNYSLAGIGKAYGPPSDYQPGQLTLFENTGKGHFKRILTRRWLVNPKSVQGVKVLAIKTLDIDQDGWTDFFVANDTVRNMLFHNEAGRFRETGEDMGLAYDNFGHTTGAMGVDSEFDSTRGELDIAVGNFANETTSLYVQSPGQISFSDVATISGIGAASRRSLSFGLVFADFDGDGVNELLQINGHVEGEINRVQQGQNYRQRPQLFWRCGLKCTADYVLSPVLSRQRWVGRGVAIGDLNHDGTVDAVVTQVAGAPQLLLNQTVQRLPQIIVRLHAQTENTQGIGAMVSRVTATQTQKIFVSPIKGYLSQSETALRFRRTNAQRATLKVRWPEGETTETELPQDAREVVVTDDGRLTVIRRDTQKPGSRHAPGGAQ